jgi:hypothetical protein
MLSPWKEDMAIRTTIALRFLKIAAVATSGLGTADFRPVHHLDAFTMNFALSQA